MRLRWLICILLFCGSNGWAAPAAGVSGVLSLVPGLGQAANGDFLEGVGWFTSIIGLMSIPSGTTRQMGYDLWQYNMYDAYRDAKPKINRYKNYTLLQNYTATFNPANLIDPIGAPFVGLGAYYGRRNHYAGIKNPTYIPYFGFVGLGEEGLFRGFLFPALSDWIGTYPGAVVSSAMFSYFHITNGKGALAPTVLGYRFLMGLLFCWQADLNEYDLRHNIFAHAWYDIFVAPGSSKGVDSTVYQAGFRWAI